MMDQWDSKRKKIVDDDEDRISNLPDPILHQILSLVNIRTAVQSSVLSMRWRYVWTSLPNLDFDYNKFPFNCLLCKYTNYYHRQRNCFTNFVNQVLFLRDNSAVNEFCFSMLDEYVDPRFVSKCISYAVHHKVRKLRVRACCLSRIQLTASFFSCQSLTELELYYCNEMLPRKSFSLPAVKALRLERYPFKEDDKGGNDRFSVSGELFFSSFPNLESLVLRNCDFSNANVTAPRLRKLEILFDLPGVSLFEHTIVVRTPRLDLFRFEGHVSLVMSSLEDLRFLDKVYIDMYPRFCEPHTDYIKERMPLNLVKMLEHLRNANSVTLSLDTIEVLKMDSQSLNNHASPFRNLKNLKLIAPREYTSFNLPSNVMNYLTNGSSCSDSFVVEFPEMWS